ncbi:MAG: hypothetical protein ACI9LY_003609, partial [Arenicella sp.]
TRVVFNGQHHRNYLHGGSRLKPDLVKQKHST